MRIPVGSHRRLEKSTWGLSIFVLGNDPGKRKLTSGGSTGLPPVQHSVRTLTTWPMAQNKRKWHTATHKPLWHSSEITKWL